MNRRVFLAGAFAASGAAPALGRPERESIAALHAELERRLSTGIPSISIAIGNRKGLLWHGAVGLSSLAPPTPASPGLLYGIGSITKTFAAVVVHRLVDEGRLDLDRAVSEYLDRDAVEGIANLNLATVRQLLNHTSGVVDWEFDPDWIRVGRGRDMRVGHRWRADETLAFVLGKPAAALPGGVHSYANTNYTLLGLVIERVTGAPALDSIRRLILKPLGLSNIKLEGFEPVDRSRCAHRYHYATPEFMRDAGLHPTFRRVNSSLVDVESSNLSTEWLAGGMLSPANELMAYLVALRDGRLLSPLAMRRLLSFIPSDEPGAEVGLGIFKTRHGEGCTMIGHAGDVLGYSAYMGWMEERDLAVVLLTNAGTMHAGHGSTSAWDLVSDGRLLEMAARCTVT